MAKINKAQLTGEIDKLKAENETLKRELASMKDRVKMIGQLFRTVEGTVG
jgi:hypothetical protein